MRPTYGEELSRLPATYQRALEFDVSDLIDLQSSLAGSPALFVASGGALAVAQLAAERHVAAHGEIGLALTPLSLAGESTVHRAGVVAFSARAAHPDVAFALRAAKTRHNYPVALVTHRAPDDLDPSLRRRLSSVVHVPVSTADGFLATNSVLLFSTLIVRASEPELILPEQLPALSQAFPPIDRPRCLLLYGPGSRSAAIDLETRLSELGLASVQVTDYRNFAHGRHTGFARHADETVVVALSSAETERLASATLDILPTGTEILRLASPLSGPGAALDLIVASMTVVGSTADALHVRASQPGVPQFGRRLYHLRAQQYISGDTHGAVDRKLAALRSSSSTLLRRHVSHALQQFAEDLAGERFAALVVDYDGTVCATDARFDLPRNDIQEQFLRLLDGGCKVGFASGRGRSLHSDLRKWVPKHHWPHITIGLYNGSLIQQLDAPIRDVAQSDQLSQLVLRLQDDQMSEFTKIDARAGQITVEPGSGTGIGIATIVDWVAEVSARGERLNVKVLRSGHSVDIVEQATSKTVVIDEVERRGEGPALSIGDRGDTGGNDFEFLASRRWTLSVDRCSGDPTRCWNLAPPGASGPDALLSYMKRFKHRRDGWHFDPGV